MSTLYIDRKDTHLSIEGKTLVCHIQRERQRPVPLALLERVVLASNVQLSSQLIGKLAAQGIDLSVINLRQPQNRATLINTSHKNPAIRQLQYRAAADSSVKENIAKQLVQGKIRNHVRFLQQLNLASPTHRRPLQKAARELNKTLTQLDVKTLPVESLRGMEGNAARHVFQAYTHIFPTSLQFTGRKRRPPPDPVNAILSLAYTLLHNRAIPLIYAAGLDPMLGFLHEDQYARDSLAADLIEPWRPHIDRWVWEWFNQRYLRDEHFTNTQDACILGKRGRAKFYAAFETRIKPLQRAMRWQILALKKAWLSIMHNPRPVYLTDDFVKKIEEENHALKIIAHEKADSWLPISRIARMIIIGDIDITTTTLCTLMQHGIPVSFADNSKPSAARLRL